jgi:hypothetical protein
MVVCLKTARFQRELAKLNKIREELVKSLERKTTVLPQAKTASTAG